MRNSGHECQVNYLISCLILVFAASRVTFNPTLELAIMSLVSSCKSSDIPNDSPSSLNYKQQVFQHMLRINFYIIDNYPRM